MKNKKKSFLFATAFVLVLIVGVYVSYNKSVDAARYLVKDGNLLLVSESLNAGKQITKSKDIKIFFDETKEQLLLGKNIVGGTPNTGDISGTKLYVVSVDGVIQDKVTDDLVQYAIFNHKGSYVYYLTLDQKLYSYDVTAKINILVMDKVGRPAVSFDDSKIAYVKLNADWQVGEYFENALGIAIFDLKTKSETQITDRWDDFAPQWTPNSNKITFASSNEYGIVSQFVVDVDSKKRKQLNNVGEKFVTDKTIGYINGNSQWSTDGKSNVSTSDNEVWMYLFSEDYESVSSKRIAFGKSPRWIDNETISVIVTEASDSKSAFIKMDKAGNIIK